VYINIESAYPFEDLSDIDFIVAENFPEVKTTKQHSKTHVINLEGNPETTYTIQQKTAYIKHKLTHHTTNQIEVFYRNKHILKYAIMQAEK
jgi:hypothetical protein